MHGGFVCSHADTSLNGLIILTTPRKHLKRVKHAKGSRAAGRSVRSASHRGDEGCERPGCDGTSIPAGLDCDLSEISCRHGQARFPFFRTPLENTVQMYTKRCALRGVRGASRLFAEIFLKKSSQVHVCKTTYNIGCAEPRRKSNIYTYINYDDKNKNQQRNFVCAELQFSARLRAAGDINRLSQVFCNLFSRQISANTPRSASRSWSQKRSIFV